MTPVLIGLIGRKRSGKDSFASVLVEEYGFRRLSFADPLREAALRLDPIIGRPALPDQLAPSGDVRLSQAVALLGWARAKDTIPEVRRVLQYLGTDAIRTIDEDFWVRAGMASAQRALEDGVAAIFTDVRFPNEADAIRARGGRLIRILRRVPGGEPDIHPSERALDGYPEDLAVQNDSSLEQLHNVARLTSQLAE